MIFVPIGSDCEVAHFLRKNKLRKYAFPFDWCVSTPDMILNVLKNKFVGFLDDIYIGKPIKRYLFTDNNENTLRVDNTIIYPLICKKYKILFPHDCSNIDDAEINNIRDKYKRRIQRLLSIISNNEHKIYLVYKNNPINSWQNAVYNDYGYEYTQNNSKQQLCGIQQLFSDYNVELIHINDIMKIINSEMM